MHHSIVAKVVNRWLQILVALRSAARMERVADGMIQRSQLGRLRFAPSRIAIIISRRIRRCNEFFWRRKSEDSRVTNHASKHIDHERISGKMRLTGN